MKHISGETIASYDKRYRANLINSVTGFKSVALIGTLSRNNVTNLAIFSQIIHVGANPPLIGVLFRPHTVPRHTLENIQDSGVFTINHISEDFVKEAHHTSARWDESEFEACGLQPAYSEGFKAPYVEGAQVQLGCSFVEQQIIQANETVFLIGAIQELRLTNGILQDDGFVDLEKAGSLCASGLDSYHRTEKIARYSYAKPDRSPQEI